MELLAVSILVAFVGGLIALAMPCCFSVLLPSYFASAFRRRSALLGMTFIFALGIATIILPVALMANAIGQFITARHQAFFVGGGFLMLLLGMLALWGRGVMPQIRLPVNLQRTDAGGVYAVGVFSGVATSCCAPVLAGIAVLSALSGSTTGTLAVAGAYVAGMVLPLLLVSLWWDRSNGRARTLLQGRVVRFKLASRPVAIHSSNLVAGGLFIAMGILTIGLGLADVRFTIPGSEFVGIYQVALERQLASWATTPLGSILTRGAIVLVVGLVALLAWKARRTGRPEGGVIPSNENPQDPAPRP